LFLLHTIGSGVSTTTPNTWIEKYIFPNGLIPSLAQLAKAAERRFVIEDVHNFGADYYLTLMAWYKNFHRALDSGQLGSEQLDQKYSGGRYNFTRVWDFYLLSCAGAFRARTNQLYQLVLSQQGALGGYQSVR
jgi:cyclopropane-fatty-acyl-phospholipid synthase